MDSAKRPLVPNATAVTPAALAAGADMDNSFTRILQRLTTKPNRCPDGRDWPRVRGYEVLAVVGSGGMGIVYKARHHHLRRTVALKMISAAALADPEFLVRFHAEAEVIARLQHPNIIQVFEIGMALSPPGEPHPNPFLALELVEGGSLAQRATTPQPPAYAARIVAKLARAAHAAHRLGVVHRDLKPANVLLTGDGEPKIADFGLAKQLRAERDSAGRFVTQAGMIMGTPEYMAPEQAVGAAPTPAFDIYALGVILYELLTARVPFRAATPVQTVDLVLRQEPVSPRRLRPDLPRDLETICLKCLEKAPDKRYDSAEALAEDLVRFLNGRIIRARPVGLVERGARWARRNPLPAALTAAVVLVSLAGLGGVVSQWREAVAQAATAEAATAEAREFARAERWERYRANLSAAASALQVANITRARSALEAAPEEYRNWEWRHFHGRLDLAQHVLGTGQDVTTDGRFSADARRVVLRGTERIRVWDTAQRQVVLSLPSSSAREHVRLSPDGKTLAYRWQDTDVVLQEVDTHRVKGVLRGHKQTVHGIEFYADGERLVTGDGGYAECLWNVRTGKLLGAIDMRKLRPLDEAFSQDGRRQAFAAVGDATARIWGVDTWCELASQSSAEFEAPAGPELKRLAARFNTKQHRILTVEGFPSNALCQWDAATGKLVCVMRRHSNEVTCFASSPDGTRIASGSRDHSVRLWDAATGQALAVLKGHRGTVTGLAFNPDGKRLVSAAEDNTLRLWDTTTGEALNELHGHTAAVLGVAYTAGGGMIVSFSGDGTVRLWDACAVENEGILRGHTGFVYGVAVHPDGRRVASASWDGTARIWDANTGRQLHRLDHGTRAIVTSVAFHPAGKMLATRARDAVRLWDVATGRELHRWNMPGDGWRDTRLVFNAQGTLLAAGCAERAIRLWDVDTRAEVAVLRGHHDEVRDVAFSPDGRWLASVEDAGGRMVRVWDLASREQVGALEGHTSGGYAVAFNPAGTLLASGATDGTVRLWDTTTWKEVAVLQHGVNVYGVAFTRDGTRLASAWADGSIRLWDVARHQEVAELFGHGNYVHHVAFSPDGTRLVSGSGDHTVRLWDTLSAQERAGSPQAQGGR